MPLVTCWLPTKNGDYSSRNLWVREVEMGFLPDEGDHMFITRDPDDPQEGVEGTVYRRYWIFDGSANLTFPDYVIDPPDEFRPHRGMTSWWTDRDGDLERKLARSGWMHYEMWKASREPA